MASLGMSWNYVIIYVIVLVVDVLVASAIALWKCSNSSTTEECDLALCGIVGSAILWLLLWFVIPHCLVCLCKAGGRLKSLTFRNISTESLQPAMYQTNLKVGLSGARPIYVTDDATSYNDIIKTSLIVNPRNICSEKAELHTSILTKLVTDTMPTTCSTVCETDTAPLINEDTANR